MSFFEAIIPVVGTISFFTAVITFIYMKYKSQHQQRMALIESGQTADIFSEKKLDQTSNSYKNGLLLTGSGIGFLFGFILSEVTRIDEIVVFPCILIGGGLGLILFYKSIRKQSEDTYS